MTKGLHGEDARPQSALVVKVVSPCIRSASISLAHH